MRAKSVRHIRWQAPRILSLPFELHEIVYKKLSPRDRVTLRLALPKSLARKLENKSFEQQLGVACHYIETHKAALIHKSKKIPPSIAKFLRAHSEKDQYVKELVDELGLLQAYDGNDKDGFIEDLSANKVSIDKIYNLHIDLKSSYYAENEIYLHYIARSTPEAFANVLQNASLSILVEMLFKLCTWETFVFRVMSQNNEALLACVLMGVFPGAETKQSKIAHAKQYLANFENLRIFANGSAHKIETLSKYAAIPRESLVALLEYAQEYMFVDSALVFLRMLKRY